MPTLTVTTRAGVESSIDAEAGRSVMEVLRDHGFDDVLAICGGCCSCATCHVYIDPAFTDRLPTPSNDERDLLGTSDHRKEGSRLCCQLQVTPEMDGLRLTIAPQD
jgi:2Fe-2S ferredoxin